MAENTRTQGTVHFLGHESEVLKGNPLGGPFVRDVIV